MKVSQVIMMRKCPIDHQMLVVLGVVKSYAMNKFKTEAGVGQYLKIYYCWSFVAAPEKALNTLTA